MHTVVKFIKNYRFSVTITCIIWIICLMPIPETPLSDVSFIDKWTHLAMYLTFSLTIALEYDRKHKNTGTRPLIIYMWLVPVLMGGLLEIVQENCTNGIRSGDWLDFITNGLGSTLATLIYILLARFRAKD